MSKLTYLDIPTKNYLASLKEQDILLLPAGESNHYNSKICHFFIN